MMFKAIFIFYSSSQFELYVRIAYTKLFSLYLDPKLAKFLKFYTF